MARLLWLRSWTAGFGAIVATAGIVGVAAILSLREMDAREDRIASIYTEDASRAEELRLHVAQESSTTRAFLLTGDEEALERSRRERIAYDEDLATIRTRLLGRGATALIGLVVATNDEYQAALAHAVALRRAAGTDSPAVSEAVESEVVPAKEALDGAVSVFAESATKRLAKAQAAANVARERGLVLIASLAAGAVVAAAMLSILLRRAMTRLAHKQAELEDSLLLVRQSNRDLDAFAGRVAHDVRGALGPIVMGARLLREGGTSASDAKRISLRIDRSAHRATSLVDALLAFSRAQGNADRTASASVGAVVADVVDQLAPQFEQADATVAVSVEDAEVACPAGLLGIVVTNVAGNAAKFVRGRPERRIEISTRRAGAGCEIRIDDTGPGIPDEARERIFEPFYRVPATTEPGTGIGLATVRRILDAHGGRVSVDSVLGQGSSFRIWLPLAELRTSTTGETARLATHPTN